MKEFCDIQRLARVGIDLRSDDGGSGSFRQRNAR
jgi:hypothetical protein